VSSRRQAQILGAPVIAPNMPDMLDQVTTLDADTFAGSFLMAKIYGGRWKMLSSLASGGQAEVYRVTDLHGEHQQPLVLKRVRNPKRHDRFRAEVEAIKRLDHPQVIKLIDHSALTNNDLSEEKQYLVMPYAEQGDLSHRVALYAGNVDSVLQVSLSLAHGLSAAHDAGIVHRDVKPQNILFPSIAHDVWLTDFGICLIRDQARLTSADEVVGPVQFMAPELEEGGQLEVSPAADIYSLGKVIYYMLSGGAIVPRERLHEDQYSAIFKGGERLKLFEALLPRMVCALPRRIQKMDHVIDSLQRIANWERDARLLPVGQKALSKIDELKSRSLRVQSQIDVNLEIRERRNAAFLAASDGILQWFRGELEKSALHIDDGDAVRAGVRDLGQDENNCPIIDSSRPGRGVELWIRLKHQRFQREHLYRVSIGSRMRITTTSGLLGAGDQSSSIEIPQEEPSSVELALIPAYGQHFDGSRPPQTNWQFFTEAGNLFQQKIRAGSIGALRRPQLMGAPPQQTVSLQMLKFTTDDWPEVAGRFDDLLSRTLETFIEAIDK
jgi:tRNA A-37 threonylcarbamoyl transferase component Bud32